MDDKVPEMYELEEPDLSSLSKIENVLKLDDPPEHDPSNLLNSATYRQSSIEEKLGAEDPSEDLLDLSEPPDMGKEYDSLKVDTTIINTLAEQSIKPIVNQSSEMHIIDGKIDENLEDRGGIINMKSNQSLSDDEFVYVKQEEVEKEDKSKVLEENTEGDELKRELEDLVQQETARLSSTCEKIDMERENVTEEPLDSFNNNVSKSISNFDDSFAPCGSDVSLIDNLSLNHRELINKDDITNITDERKSITADFNDLIEREQIYVEEESIVLASVKSLKNEPDLELLSVDNESDERELLDEKLSSSDIQSISINAGQEVNCKLHDIINWTHAIPSIIVFLILMFIELGIMMEFSIISLIAYCGMLLIAINVLNRVAVSLGVIDNRLWTTCTFDKEAVFYCVDTSLNYVNYLHKEIKSIAYVESYVKNIKVFAVLWILRYVGNLFNLQSLIFIGTVLLFSLPVIYTKFEKEINQFYNNTMGSISGIVNKIKSKFQ